MLCSARELRLSEDHGGLLELAADAPVGANVRDVLKLDDHVFTLKLTPNLGHALGVFGIARELSAITGAPSVSYTHLDVYKRQGLQSDAVDEAVRRVNGWLERNRKAAASAQRPSPMTPVQ